MVVMRGEVGVIILEEVLVMVESKGGLLGLFETTKWWGDDGDVSEFQEEIPVAKTSPTPR